MSEAAVPAGRRRMLIILVAAFAVMSASTTTLLRYQAAGADFSCFWAGALTALQQPAKLYDFAHVTALQGWPLGHDALRPYIYPPSALLVFIPFALPTYWAGYGLWVLATGALFAVAGVRAKAPLWFLLMPSVALVAYCGQVTFLIGGLVIAGLALRDRRILAGILFGVAAAIKPQMLLLLPIALIAERRWTTIAATGATGAAMVVASLLIWGVQPWLEWLPAVGRFQHVIFDNPELVADAITPYAALVRLGLNGNLAFLLVPPVVAATWLAFRNGPSTADRLLALLGGALLISPYAMNYELALLAPAVATYVASSGDRRWPAFVIAALAYVAAPPGLGLIAALALIPIALTPWPASGPPAVKDGLRVG